MFDLQSIFNKAMSTLSGQSSDNSIEKKPQSSIPKDKLATFLKTSPEALEAFEKAYGAHALSGVSDNLFEVNSRQASAALKAGHSNVTDNECADALVDRIVNELLAQGKIYKYTREASNVPAAKCPQIAAPVTREEIGVLPAALRPQLAGNLMLADMEADNGYELLNTYKKALEAKTPAERKRWYDFFRQGLDILDLDALTYAIIDTNPNSMGHWFPPLVAAIKQQQFFKVPDTTILKVPITLLQLTRTDYQLLTPTTMRIVDEFCYKAFGLDENKDYFIKTGTYSSKFDFRNARVRGAKEVRELGEYLLYIHFQALQYASPLMQPCMYGVSTTTEWVVREFIADKENNPCIYKGMPLHTEYRVFVDFDNGEILGVNPYWDPEVMKTRFGSGTDKDSPHQQHDYIIFKMHEEVLMHRYHDNVHTVVEKMQAMLPNIKLSGQWSIDIMQNGDDFFVIDMALAKDSALRHCIPQGKLRPIEESWLPQIPSADNEFNEGEKQDEKNQ